ncbi:ATP-binding protein [Chloroflexota bacterium]
MMERGLTIPTVRFYGRKRIKDFGLFNIRERVHHIGGHIEVESSPGHGTRVTVVAPLKRE